MLQKLNLNAAIWQGKCFLVWSPYDDGTTYVCHSGECADPGQTVVLVVRRARKGTARSAAPGLHCKATSAAFPEPFRGRPETD